MYFEYADRHAIACGISATTTAAIQLEHSLAKGWTGEEVSALQTMLTKLGFFKENVTGYFGAITEASVKDFQEANNIAAVGIVGPLTRQLLMQIGVGR